MVQLVVEMRVAGLDTVFHHCFTDALKLLLAATLSLNSKRQSSPQLLGVEEVDSVAFASTPKISAGPLLRDSIFYGIAVVTLFAFFSNGCISIVEALMFPAFYIFYVTIVIVLQLKCCTKIMSRIECCCDRDNNSARATELTQSLISGGPSLNAEPGLEPEIPGRKRKNTMSEFFNFDEEGNFMREIVQQKRYHFGIPRTAGLLRPHRMQTVSMDPIALSKALGENKPDKAAAAAGGGLGSAAFAENPRHSKRASSFSASNLSSHKRLFELSETPGIKHSRTEVLSRRRQDDQQAVVDDADPEELDPLDAAGEGDDQFDDKDEDEEEDRIEPENFQHHMQIMRGGFRAKWKAIKPCSNVFCVLTYRFVLARRLTIPAVTMETWSREEAALSVAFSPAFFFIATV